MNKSKVTLFLLLILALGGLTGCAFSDWIARLLGNDVLIARYEAETAASKQAEAYELRLLREADVDLQDAINEGYIFKANAQAITRQSRAHVMLQGVMAVLLIGALLFDGLMLAWFLTADPRPQLWIPWRKDAKQ